MLVHVTFGPTISFLGEVSFCVFCPFKKSTHLCFLLASLHILDASVLSGIFIMHYPSLWLNFIFLIMRGEEKG